MTSWNFCSDIGRFPVNDFRPHEFDPFFKSSNFFAVEQFLAWAPSWWTRLGGLAGDAFLNENVEPSDKQVPFCFSAIMDFAN